MMYSDGMFEFSTEWFSKAVAALFLWLLGRVAWDFYLKGKIANTLSHSTRWYAKRYIKRLTDELNIIQGFSTQEFTSALSFVLQAIILLLLSSAGTIISSLFIAVILIESDLHKHLPLPSDNATWMNFQLVCALIGLGGMVSLGIRGFKLCDKLLIALSPARSKIRQQELIEIIDGLNKQHGFTVDKSS